MEIEDGYLREQDINYRRNNIDNETEYINSRFQTGIDRKY